ncbi:Inner nuclear membrane protein SRC1 [Erysiphe neolycopersici]|uniref:Inner nuclear membrane protein SRC1 n=1 Tax=Erysiphe neolycopersici TaxID=212602 RepID=A0A420I470_9PEZI|nr:Inner nuclear membrane protein SRC1 [Erysiphe neolycopersici]
MSDIDSIDYLQTDFDPTSLTVPRLRSILVNYDISYPSTAKKAQLLKIFVDEILSQRDRILKERERARRSSRGILNANSRQSIEVEQEIIPLSRSSRRSTRNTSSTLQVDEQEDDRAAYKKERTSSPVKRTPRASSKHARASDTETGLEPEVRRKSLRTKKSETPSHYQLESNAANYDFPSERPKAKKVDQGDSAFTDDNPFQSGSSPPSGKSPEPRRKSQGIPKERRKISNSVRRRRTEIPQVNDNIYPPSSTVFEAPITQSFSRVSNTFRNLHENVIEPGEEFTPEEQSELIREKATSESKSVSNLRKNRKSKNSSNFTGPFWVMILITLIGYSVWYRQEKIAVGYCDVGKEASPLISIPYGIPNWARILFEPSCEPCPHHAYCLARMVVECEKDYLLKLHPLSLAGIIPLAPTCEPDGVKVRKVKAVADRATELLRDKRAKFECGALDDDGVPISSPEVDANDLKKEVSKKRRKDMPESEYEDIWTGALEEMKTRNEVQTTVDETHFKLSSNSLASLPVTCALRRSFCNTLGQYRFEIGGLIMFLLSLLKLRSIIITRKKVNAAIPSLVSITLERLTKQALLHQENKNIDRWISIGQLRDDVLRNEHSIDKRESVWRKVRIVIETNSNIRSSQKEDRNGEVSRVWEWIGALESRPAY